jgi:excisionase family DNA binding protein
MDRVTVAEAAERLGVSQDAVYKRIKRGTIPWDKDEDGKTVVYIEVANGSTDEPKSSTDESTDRLKTSTDSIGSSSIDLSLDVLVDELRDRVRFLEEELRRKDTILMSLVQRVPELEAPPETRDARETASKDVSGGGGDNEAPPSNTEEPRASSWWKRFFGFDTRSNG